jgi:hypothetical protein
MPAPGVYEGAVVDPFADAAPAGSERDHGILYATDRKPLKDQGKASYYANERGHVLRLGIAQVEYFGRDMPMEEARHASLMKQRTGELPLSVRGVEEFGVLEDSVTAGTWAYQIRGLANLALSRGLRFAPKDKSLRVKSRDFCRESWGCCREYPQAGSETAFRVEPRAVTSYGRRRDVFVYLG